MPARSDRTLIVAVLAAGSASRFGGGKLDADCAGKPLGQWVIDAVIAAGLAPGVIVVGPKAPGFARQAEGWRQLVNPEPELGLGTSVALACGEAHAQSCDLLLLLADMPLVTSAHLRMLLQCPSHAATGYGEGRLGVPALIRHAQLPRFARLRGDRGAGPMLASLAAIECHTAPADMLIDVDSPADLERVEAVLLGRQPDQAG